MASSHELIGKAGKIVSAYALDGKGTDAAAVSKMAFGNKLGVTIERIVCPKRHCLHRDLVISWRRFRLEKVGCQGAFEAAGLSGHEELVGWVNEEAELLSTAT